jgi:hypothetical protein
LILGVSDNKLQKSIKLSFERIDCINRAQVCITIKIIISKLSNVEEKLLLC